MAAWARELGLGARLTATRTGDAGARSTGRAAADADADGSMDSGRDGGDATDEESAADAAKGMLMGPLPLDRLLEPALAAAAVDFTSSSAQCDCAPAASLGTHPVVVDDGDDCASNVAIGDSA